MKIGLFFGSFNPIHIGHMIIANHILEHSDLDRLWFVVSPHNPFKEKRTLLSDHHRLMLVKEAVEDNPLMRACDIEFGMDQPSYTAKTLILLKEKYPEHTFSLIMGQDNLSSLPKWHNFSYLLDNYRIFVYPRFFSSREVPETNTNFLQNNKATIIFLSDVPISNISSSFIRKSIQNGKSVRYLLPERVFNYIDEMKFYQSDE